MKYKLTMAFLLVLFLSGCMAFKHGYTWSEAKNSYNLVTGDERSFGDRRLEYNRAFHRNSALSNFLDCKCNDRGLPNFIYEYQTADKRRGIKLYYVQRDSVFVFEEPGKGKLQSILKDARKMDDYEQQTYERLKAGK
ncbi:MAG TPA: hypothetical protein VEY32_10670 [Flavisolibacter sp.]|nr:hypothetical protein [Flavisolibacter sp.]